MSPRSASMLLILPLTTLTSRYFGIGNIVSRWRHFARLPARYFADGDERSRPPSVKLRRHATLTPNDASIFRSIAHVARRPQRASSGDDASGAKPRRWLYDQRLRLAADAFCTTSLDKQHANRRLPACKPLSIVPAAGGCRPLLRVSSSPAGDDNGRLLRRRCHGGDGGDRPLVDVREDCRCVMHPFAPSSFSRRGIDRHGHYRPALLSCSMLSPADAGAYRCYGSRINLVDVIDNMYACRALPASRKRCWQTPRRSITAKGAVDTWTISRDICWHLISRYGSPRPRHGAGRSRIFAMSRR